MEIAGARFEVGAIGWQELHFLSEPRPDETGPARTTKCAKNSTSRRIHSRKVARGEGSEPPEIPMVGLSFS
jgi:hypothetical protein